jgi:site-specific recombinase XerD
MRKPSATLKPASIALDDLQAFITGVAKQGFQANSQARMLSAVRGVLSQLAT